MKKSSVLIFLILSSSFLLTSCSGVNTIDTETPSIPVITDESIGETSPSETTSITSPDEQKMEWIAVWEQTNLAPSDTPRGIAEGGLYLPYTPTALAQASGNIVLFFYASWSPASITTHKDVVAKVSTMPKDLTILQVNFDDANDMKQQYWVIEQDTFVQVTNTGELIKKWRGANSLADIVKQIQK